MKLWRLALSCDVDKIPQLRKPKALWYVIRCWPVAFASRAVDMDRRGPKRLRLLSPDAYFEGDIVNPRIILQRYLEWRKR